MTCPGCGAPMRVEAGKDYLVCDYCGNVHVPNTNEDGVRVLGETTAPEGSLECPVCALALVDASVDGQRVLYCQRCRGLLISMDIFVPIVGDLRSRRERSIGIVPPLDSKELDRQVYCPRCRQMMDTHVYGGGGNVVISDCERCQVNWLDHGELDRIVRAEDRQFHYG